MKKRVLEQVDHSKINYPPFRKNFYIEVPEIAKMTDEEVAAYRKSLEGIRIRVTISLPPSLPHLTSPHLTSLSSLLHLPTDSLVSFSMNEINLHCFFSQQCRERTVLNQSKHLLNVDSALKCMQR
jgi:hypothetical protein